MKDYFNNYNNNNGKGFLNGGIILTLALVMICVFCPEWNIGSAAVVVLVGLLAAAQWALFFWVKRK